jgi:hypothetical protein
MISLNSKFDLKPPFRAFNRVFPLRIWLITSLGILLILFSIFGVARKFLYSRPRNNFPSTPLSTVVLSSTLSDKPLTVEVGPLSAVPKYTVLEISLTAQGSYGNPYLLMPGDNNTPGFVVGEFSGPNGEKIAVDGFWDGGDSWRIRFAPISEGTWTYTTISSDLGLDRHTGSFNCVTSSNKGFARVNPSHPHHFMWEDGTPLYWASTSVMIAHFDEAGRDAQGNGWRIDDGTFQSFLDVRSMQGFNATHWGYYGFNKKQFNERTQQNEGGPPFTDYNPDLLNPAYYQYGDQRVEALLNRGIIPEFTLGWPDQNIVGSIGHERLKRYWRYLIARYAAFNIVYNLFGEVQEFGSNYLAIADDYGQLTRKWDPYDHLISTHTVGNLDPDFVNLPWLDFITLQLPTKSTSNYLQYNKPVVNSEYGGYEDIQVDGEGLRPLIWDVRMHGGYFVYESWGSDLQSSGATYSMLNTKFFKDNTQYWLLEYHPEFYNAEPGLANPGKEYVIYLPKGGSVTVDLSDASGSVKAEWYNPRTGVYTGQRTAEGGGNRTFGAPFSGDAVLLIKSADNYSQPHHIYLPLTILP